ncbi:hypothetical protein [Salinimicrobium terrae]|uniref:hypothetical protein n=1 Tax=Salinimicrobium terrae TaxID=470866 RepID=UPI0012EB66C7|nr:hypothetical protein [Salinimicrobium terrae]
MKEENKIAFTGGSRIGSVNKTFPFSKLIIESQKITLKSTFSGTIEISSADLLGAEEVFYVPILAQGIKIRYKNPDTKKTLIFWSFRDPKNIFKVLEEQGWVTTAVNPGTGSEKQENSGTGLYKEIKLLISPPLLVLYAAMVLFAAFVQYKNHHRYDGYERINHASGYRLEVKNMSIDNGIVSLNDSLLISGGSKLISDKPGWFRHDSRPLFGEYPIPPNFSDLEPPFEFIKDPATFNLQVVKWGDTLEFQIPDPHYRDPQDPTFGELYDKYFGN